MNGFTEEHRAAFQKHGTQRIYIAYDRDEAGEGAAQEHAAQLMEIGIECFRVQFPKNMDANEYALKVQPASKSLGIMLNRAAWLGKGERPTVAVIEPVKAEPVKIEPVKIEPPPPEPAPQIEAQTHQQNVETPAAPASDHVVAANNDVPQNPCNYAGRNLDPSAWAAMGQNTKNNPLTTTYDFAKGFAIGGYLDAQPMATGNAYEKAAYGNYVFGAYMSAAGFPLSVTLAGANEIAFYHSLSNSSQYSGRQMDSFFWSLPAANVANITAGYNAQRNGTLCHK